MSGRQGIASEGGDAVVVVDESTAGIESETEKINKYTHHDLELKSTY